MMNAVMIINYYEYESIKAQLPSQSLAFICSFKIMENQFCVKV